ncbi:MAG: hypothetical protein J6Y94_02485 [Bacteriovoracaceae bacterium]|nr:hypothetical protein [Bacteriovoracaceae bacterium]
MNSILPLGRRGKNFNFSFKYRPGLAWPLLLLLSLGLVACAHTGSKDVVYQQGRKTVRLVPAKDVKNCEIIATLIGETRSG